METNSVGETLDNKNVLQEDELLNEIDTQNALVDGNELNDDLERQLLGDNDDDVPESLLSDSASDLSNNRPISKQIYLQEKSTESSDCHVTLPGNIDDVNGVLSATSVIPDNTAGLPCNIMAIADENSSQNLSGSTFSTEEKKEPVSDFIHTSGPVDKRSESELNLIEFNETITKNDLNVEPMTEGDISNSQLDCPKNYTDAVGSLQVGLKPEKIATEDLLSNETIIKGNNGNTENCLMDSVKETEMKLKSDEMTVSPEAGTTTTEFSEVKNGVQKRSAGATELFINFDDVIVKVNAEQTSKYSEVEMMEVDNVDNQSKAANLLIEFEEASVAKSNDTNIEGKTDLMDFETPPKNGNVADVVEVVATEKISALDNIQATQLAANELLINFEEKDTSEIFKNAENCIGTNLIQVDGEKKSDEELLIDFEDVMEMKSNSNEALTPNTEEVNKPTKSPIEDDNKKAGVEIKRQDEKDVCQIENAEIKQSNLKLDSSVLVNGVEKIEPTTNELLINFEENDMREISNNYQHCNVVDIAEISAEKTHLRPSLEEKMVVEPSNSLENIESLDCAREDFLSSETKKLGQGSDAQTAMNNDSIPTNSVTLELCSDIPLLLEDTTIIIDFKQAQTRNSTSILNSTCASNTLVHNKSMVVDENLSSFNDTNKVTNENICSLNDIKNEVGLDNINLLTDTNKSEAGNEIIHENNSSCITTDENKSSVLETETAPEIDHASMICNVIVSDLLTVAIGRSESENSPDIDMKEIEDISNEMSYSSAPDIDHASMICNGIVNDLVTLAIGRSESKNPPDIDMEEIEDISNEMSYSDEHLLQHEPISNFKETESSERICSDIVNDIIALVLEKYEVNHVEYSNADAIESESLEMVIVPTKKDLINNANESKTEEGVENTAILEASRILDSIIQNVVHSSGISETISEYINTNDPSIDTYYHDKAEMAPEDLKIQGNETSVSSKFAISIDINADCDGSLIDEDSLEESLLANVEDEKIDVDEEILDVTSDNLRICASLVDEMVNAAVDSAEVMSFRLSVPKKSDTNEFISGILNEIIDSVIDKTESYEPVDVNMEVETIPYLNNAVSSVECFLKAGTHETENETWISSSPVEQEEEIENSLSPVICLSKSDGPESETLVVVKSIVDSIVLESCERQDTEEVSLNEFLESIVLDIVKAVVTDDSESLDDNNDDGGFEQWDSYDEATQDTDDCLNESSGPMIVMENMDYFNKNQLNQLDIEAKLIDILSDTSDKKRLEKVGFKVGTLQEREEFDIGNILDVMGYDPELTEPISTQNFCANIINEIIAKITSVKAKKRHLEDGDVPESKVLKEDHHHHLDDTASFINSIIDEIILDVVCKKEIVFEILDEVLDNAVGIVEAQRSMGRKRGRKQKIKTLVDENLPKKIRGRPKKNDDTPSPKKRGRPKANLLIVEAKTIAPETFQKIEYSPTRHSHRTRKSTQQVDYSIPYIKEEPVEIVEDRTEEEEDIKPILPLPEEIFVQAAEELKRSRGRPLKRNQVTVRKVSPVKKKVEEAKKKTNKRVEMSEKQQIELLRRKPGPKSRTMPGSSGTSKTTSQIVEVSKIRWKVPAILRTKGTRRWAPPEPPTTRMRKVDAPLVKPTSPPGKRSRKEASLSPTPIKKKGREKSLSPTPIRKKGREASISPTTTKKKGRDRSLSPTPIRKKGREKSISPPPMKKKGWEKSLSPTPVKRKGREASLSPTHIKRLKRGLTIKLPPQIAARASSSSSGETSKTKPPLNRKVSITPPIHKKVIFSAEAKTLPMTRVTPTARKSTGGIPTRKPEAVVLPIRATPSPNILRKTQYKTPPPLPRSLRSAPAEPEPEPKPEPAKKRAIAGPASKVNKPVLPPVSTPPVPVPTPVVKLRSVAVKSTGGRPSAPQPPAPTQVARKHTSNWFKPSHDPHKPSTSNDARWAKLLEPEEKRGGTHTKASSSENRFTNRRDSTSSENRLVNHNKPSSSENRFTSRRDSTSSENRFTNSRDSFSPSPDRWSNGNDSDTRDEYDDLVEKLREKRRLMSRFRPCYVRLERQPFIDHLLPSKAKRQDARFCELCDPKRFFVSKDGLVEHLKTEHGDTFGSGPVAVGDRCPGCDKKYHSQNRLSAHMRTCPAVAVLSAKTRFSDAPSASYSKPVEEDLKFNCEICSAKFSLWTAFESHKRSHNTENDPLNLDVEDDNNAARKFKSELLRRGPGLVMKFRREREEPIPSVYRCEVCGQPFTKTSELDIHRLTHVRIKEERLSPELEIVEEYIATRPRVPTPPPPAPVIPPPPVIKKPTARKSTGGLGGGLMRIILSNSEAMRVTANTSNIDRRKQVFFKK